MRGFHKFFLLFLLATVSLFGDESALLFFKGHLGKDELQPIKEQIQKFQTKPPNSITIAINSISGNINEVLEIARQLYALKLEKNLKISAYIEENALGPAAILPFLADEIEGTLFIAWGDIPLSSENEIPTNILRNQVLSLIPPNAPKKDLLFLLAQGMVDAKLFVIDDNGWKLSSDEKDLLHTRISVFGQTLVVNQNQLKELGLLKRVVTPESFLSRFQKSTDEEQKPEVVISAFEQELAAHIKYSETGPNRIGYIAINDRNSAISQATWIYVRKALDYYKKHKPLFIILELNTPGGEVFAAENISDALKEIDTQYNIPVVTFINNWAMSAGAMLAYSSRFITIVKDGSMGAAEPIIEAGGTMQPASEKVNSALRADFASRAQFYGRNPYIAEAMVDKDIILVLRHGKIVKLDNENQIRTQGPSQDTLISPKGKLLTLNAEQMIEYGVAGAILPPTKLEPITEQERENEKWPFKKELLSQQPYFSKIPNAIVDTFEMDWKTRFFMFLANPLVQSALFLGLMLGFYMEMNNPGMTLPGAIGMICLFLIVLSSFSQEIASWLELIFVALGLLIIVVDLFVLPTFGILGFFGAALFLFGLFSLMLPGIGEISFEYNTKTFNAAGEVFLERLGLLSATLILGVILMALLGRYLMPSFSGFNRFVLKGHEQEGYISGVDPQSLPTQGTVGTALTSLRPSGKVLIHGEIFDALSAGRFIDKDAEVSVSRIDGSVLVVTEIAKET